MNLDMFSYDPCGHHCNFTWSLFWLFRPFCLCLLPEQNSKIMKTTIPPANYTLKMSYAGARPEQKAATTFAPHPQLKEEIIPKRHP